MSAVPSSRPGTLTAVSLPRPYAVDILSVGGDDGGGGGGVMAAYSALAPASFSHLVSRLAGEGIAIGVLAGVGVALSLCFWVALSRYKQSRVVRLGQPALSKTFVVS